MTVLVTCVLSLSYGSEFHWRHLIGWFLFLCQENTARKFSSDPVTICLVAASIGSKKFTPDSFPVFFVPCVKNIVARYLFFLLEMRVKIKYI